MGRKWSNSRKRKQNQDAKKRGDDRDAAAEKLAKYGQERSPYELVESGNFKLEAYYAYQGLHDYFLDEKTGDFLPCTTSEIKDAERQRWLGALKAILPASFRIGTDVDETLREKLEKELEGYVGKKMEIEIQPKGGDRRIKEKGLKAEKKMIAPAKKIPFVPHAYQLSLDRQTIRRNTGLNEFHEWLKVQTEAGFVTRQETVSMIPPVVLNPEPHHKVLDMCAAPGSKTSQLLEVINLPAKVGDSEPSGFVIANDSDYKRAYMLVHQMRRINSPALFISCCDAKFFPLIRSEEYPTEGIFDRVLCDVPCSGDGTARKNPGIWKRWTSLNGMGLHMVQLGIALKGARLARVGGYMVYSTCSMNPMENESVVAELLRSSDGSLELVDPRENLDGMVARPGVSKWKVLCEARSNREIKDVKKKRNEKMQARREAWENNGAEMKDDTNPAEAAGSEEEVGAEEDESIPWGRRVFEPSNMDDNTLKSLATAAGLNEFDTFEDVPENLRRRVRESCFPPTKEEVNQFHLERCLRIMPQDMDTGGFFVCLLKKVAPMNARARARFEKLEKELDDEENNKTEEPDQKKAKLEDGDAAVNESSAVVEVADELAKNEKDSAAVVRGHVKRVYLRDKDGNKHDKLGRDDFIPIPEDIFGPLRDYYGLATSSFEEGSYMARACGEMKVLHFITKPIKSLIDSGFQERITVIHSGVKGFTRCNKDCDVNYRIAQEGVHFVAPHMTKRKIIADIDDFRKCLEPDNVELGTFSEVFAEQVRSLTFGCFVVCLKGYENDYLKKLVLVVWRCRSDCCSTMANQAELDGMKSKLRSITGESAPSS
jgi:16S rRNA C967 or C1407 C5-methylase (RsmB/RsmF family)